MVRFWRGLSVALFALFLLPAAAGAAPSDVDPGFGTQGSATVPFAPDFAEGNDSVLQANGGIVIVGNKGGDHTWPVARLTAGGQPDASFDGDGKLTIPVQGRANAVAQQADGKLVVAGTEGTGSDPSPYLPHFVLARLNTDGSLDGSFGSGGIVRTPLAAGSGFLATPHALAIQPDGKIVAAGSSPAGGVHVALVRYGTDGTEDPGFGTGGKAELPTPGGDSEARAVLIDPTGNVVVAGYGPDGAGDRVALLARFTPAGQPDATFGSGGKALADWHTGDDIESVATGIVREPSGKLVAGGTTEIDRKPGFAVARYGADGQPDPSFGEAGITRTPVGYGEAEGLVRAPDGKLLLAGWAETPAGESEALARYDADGAPDAGFGSGGLLTHRVAGSSTRARDVHVQPADGRIVVTGFAGSAFSASRFMGDPPPPDPGGDDPGGTDGPGTDGSEGCTSEVRRLLLVARAACFRDDGDWKVSAGPVRLNGLDLVPVDSTVIRIRPSDFRLRTQAPSGEIGIVELRAGTVPLARQGFDVGVGSTLAFRASESASIDGFRIAGDVTVTFSQEGEAGLDGTIATPYLSGALKARLRMDGGLAVDTLTMDVPGFDYGALGTVEPLHLAFSPGGGGWIGSAGFRLGRGQNALGFGGRMTASDGSWREVSGTAGVLPLGVIPVRDVSFAIRRTAAGMQVAGSGKVPVGGFGGLDAMRMEGAVSADVPLSLGDLQDFAWRLRGTATLFETAALVGGELRWDNKRPTFSGQAEWGLHAGQFRNLGSGGVAALATPLDATVSAKARYADAQASGSGTAKIFGLGIGVDMAYGSRGIGACGDVRVGVGPLSAVVRGGATVHFHPTRYAALVGACDIASLSSASAAAAGARPVRLPGGRRVGVLVVRGKGAPPRLRVSGPGRAGLTMAKGRKPQRSGRFLVLQEPGRDTTYVLIAKPRGGRWSVHALPGSAAVRSVAPAAALPPIRVTGKLTRGKGRARVLRWRGTGVSGHVLRFREVGGGVNRLLRSTRKAKGRLSFTPAKGRAGSRRIVAVAERDGIPRTTLQVARFKP